MSLNCLKSHNLKTKSAHDKFIVYFCKFTQHVYYHFNLFIFIRVSQNRMKCKECHYSIWKAFPKRYKISNETWKQYQTIITVALTIQSYVLPSYICISWFQQSSWKPPVLLDMTWHISSGFTTLNLCGVSTMYVRLS